MRTTFLAMLFWCCAVLSAHALSEQERIWANKVWNIYEGQVVDVSDMRTNRCTRPFAPVGQTDTDPCRANFTLILGRLQEEQGILGAQLALMHAPSVFEKVRRYINWDIYRAHNRATEPLLQFVTKKYLPNTRVRENFFVEDLDPVNNLKGLRANSCTQAPDPAPEGPDLDPCRALFALAMYRMGEEYGMRWVMVALPTMSPEERKLLKGFANKELLAEHEADTNGLVNILKELFPARTSTLEQPKL